MTHTPGPWRLGEKNSYHKQHYRPILTENARLFLKDEICWICNDEDENEPNARLIAAAPELLKVCLFVLDELEHLTTDDFSKGGDKPARDRLEEVINLARE